MKRRKEDEYTDSYVCGPGQSGAYVIRHVDIKKSVVFAEVWDWVVKLVPINTKDIFTFFIFSEKKWHEGKFASIEN